MSGSSQHLNADTIEELKDLMGDDYSLLVDMFVKDSAARILDIKDAILSGDPENVRRSAHGFKGSASNMGALNLAKLCNSLEELGRSGELSNAKQLASDIESAYSSVEKLLIE